MTESERIVRERDHAAMIDRPDLWPLGRVLPLKKPGKVFDDDGTGFIINPDGVHWEVEFDRYTVFVGVVGLSDPKKCPRVQYDSAQAIVDDGWVVD